MAANKFATMLHKNCHKIILILIYAVLEWILILLLLVNSFFSYLITKFANFFGLKPSCTWCSRLDHVFDSKNIENSRFDHVCEAHGAEISKLSYCSNHKRLAESKNLCSNCSSSTPLDYGTVNEISSFFTWMSEGISENGEQNRINRCSCCDEILSRSVYSPPLIFKPSWDVLDFIHKKASLSQEDLMKNKTEFEEKGRENDRDDQREFEKDDQLICDGGQKTEILEEFVCDSNNGNRSEKSDSFEVQEWNSSANEDDESIYLVDMLLQNADYTDSDRFICIELIDTPSDSRLMEEHEKGDEEIEKSSTPSGEKDDAEAPDNFQESEQKDDNMPELDDCAEAVGGTILQHNSDAELFVTNSTIISLNEEQQTNNQDEAKEKRDSPEEGSGLEDCLDESLISEMEVDDENLSRENFKAMIKAQEKALKALYAELEEEREAAAEAAKETMAMITKLQEEKAAMQIEALQYQRMMEEQAEYDQEALQLLNDLMIKREKEKKELEKELEIYRNNVIDYEAQEKTMMIRRRNGGLRRTTSTASSGNGDQSIDDHSIDLECEEEHNFDDSLEELEETGGECMTNLSIPDLSLAEFDEERLSILEELKILEAKLLALHDDDERKSVDVMAKKLLPLFDATENRFADEEFDKEEMINSKILIHEELGHVYERLQALEEDKDFLNHCISSMMKGNKGLALLQEILQHLRDLKSVELSARNLAEIPLSDASMIREHQD